MKIYLTSTNLVYNPNIKEPINKELFVTYKQAQQISSCPINHAWKYDEENDEFTLITILDNENLRALRQKECFDKIDTKSRLWWDNLTKEQYEELNTWYKAWLDVTTTKTVPELPEVLKK